MGADVVAVWPGKAGAVAGGVVLVSERPARCGGAGLVSRGVVGVVHGYFKVRLRMVSTLVQATLTQNSTAVSTRLF